MYIHVDVFGDLYPSFICLAEIKEMRIDRSGVLGLSRRYRVLEC